MSEGSLWTDFKAEVWIMLKLALPAITGQSAFLVMNIVDTFFIGHIGDLELAGAALGTSWAVCLSFIPIGLCNGLDTLISQAFGAGNMVLVGVWFHVALIITSVSCAPILAIMYYTKEIMVAMGQEPVVSDYAARYVIWLIPGIVPFTIFNCILHWLQNQRIMFPSTVIAVFGILLNIPANYLMIWGVGEWKGLGLEGAAVATSILRVLMLIGLWVYVLIKKYHLATSSKFYIEAFYLKNIWEYLAFSTPAMLMSLLEIMGLEGSTLLVGLMQDPVAIAAHGMGLYTLLLNFLIPYGWAIAVNVHLGNLIGAGEAARGQRVAFFSVIVVLVQMFVHSMIFLWARSAIVQIWTPEKKVDFFGQQIIAIVALCSILDGYQVTTGSVLKAIGRQRIGSFGYLFGFYVIALPGGYIFSTILGYGVTAYWWGIAIGLAIIGLIFTIVLLRTDWVEEVRLSKKRTQYKAIESDSEEVVTFKSS